MTTQDRLVEILAIQSPWCDLTFGPPNDRRSARALAHMKREADEAAAHPSDVEEFADCLLLLLDAARCAGHSLESLVASAESKLQRNMARKWGEPDAQGIVEHIREAQPPKDAAAEERDSRIASFDSRLAAVTAERDRLTNLCSQMIGDDGPDLDAYLDGHVELPTRRLRQERDARTDPHLEIRLEPTYPNGASEGNPERYWLYVDGERVCGAESSHVQYLEAMRQCAAKLIGFGRNQVKKDLDVARASANDAWETEHEMERARDAALTDLARCREVLRSVEWSGESVPAEMSDGEWNGVPACPCCHEPEPEHKTNCALAAAKGGK